MRSRLCLDSDKPVSSSDLNHHLKNGPKNVLRSFHRTFSFSGKRRMCDHFKVGVLPLGRFLELPTLENGEKWPYWWSNSPYLSGHMNDTVFWVLGNIPLSSSMKLSALNSKKKKAMAAQTTSFRATLMIADLASYLKDSNLQSVFPEGHWTLSYHTHLPSYQQDET